ncbi:MAG: hypothetical protein IT547_17710 [Hyphomonadaceae bacterium]|nr:hypothetical protein [Hyphomonadaceae bacterium]
MSNEDREPLDLGVGGQVLGVIVLVIVALILWAFLAPAWQAISQQARP